MREVHQRFHVEFIKEYDSGGALLINKKYEYYDSNGFGVPIAANAQQYQIEFKEFFKNYIDQPQQGNTIFNLSNFPVELFDTETLNIFPV